MTIGYRFSDPRIGFGPAASPATSPGAAPQWTASQTWAALAYCVNNGYLFRTVAGGAGNTSGDGPSQGNLVDASCTWVAVGPLNPLYAQDAAATVTVGTIAKGISPDFGEGDFQYVKFTGTVVAGDFVVVDSYAQTAVVMPTTPVSGVGGISMASQASGTFGWVMIKGVHGAANVANAVAAGGTGNSGAAAGRLIAATTNNTLSGCWIRLAAVGALNFAAVELRYPTQIKITSAA